MAKFTHVVHVNLNTSYEQRDTDNEIYFDMDMIYLHIRVEIQNIPVPVLDNIFVPVHFAEVDRCFSILKNVLI